MNPSQDPTKKTGTIPRNLRRTEQQAPDGENNPRRDHDRNVVPPNWEPYPPVNFPGPQRSHSAHHSDIAESRSFNLPGGFEFSVRDQAQSTPRNRQFSAQERHHVHEELEPSHRRLLNLLPQPEADKSNLSKKTRPLQDRPKRRGTNENSFEFVSSASPGRNSTTSLTGAIFKTAGGDSRNELKTKVAESQEKLEQVLAHHAALKYMKEKIEEQLRTARAHQNRLLFPADLPANEGAQGSEALLQDVDSVRERIQNLSGLFQSQTDVIDLFGGGDEDVINEQLRLLEKLQELRSKQQQIENLAGDLQSMNVESSASGLQPDFGSGSRPGSMEDLHECTCDEEGTNAASQLATSHLRENVNFQLIRLNAQMDQLAHGQECSHLESIGSESISSVRPEVRTANQSRQRQQLHQTKCDNTSVANIGVLHNVLPQSTHQMEIQQTKQRLREFAAMLDHATEVRNREESAHQELRAGIVPEQERSGVSEINPYESYMSLQDVDSIPTALPNESQELLRDTELGIASNLVQQPSICEQHVQTKKLCTGHGRTQKRLPSSLQEKKTNNKRDTELIAKRKELEEMMHKDQGQSSSLNQDVSSDSVVKPDLLAGYSTSIASWGGSVGEPADNQVEFDTGLSEAVGSSGLNTSSSTVCARRGRSEDVTPAARPDGQYSTTQVSQRPQNSNQKEIPCTGMRAKWISAPHVVTSREHQSQNAGNRIQESVPVNQHHCQMEPNQQPFLNQCNFNAAPQQAIFPPGWIPPVPWQNASDVHYQQLLAANQVQQHQLMLSTMHQISYMLWLQQRDMVNLRSAVMSLQQQYHTIGQNIPVPVNLNVQPGEPPRPPDNSNMNSWDQFIASPSTARPSNVPKQHLPLSLSGGLTQQSGSLPGVVNAFSLPNLAAAPPSSMGVSPAMAGLQQSIYTSSSPLSPVESVNPWLGMSEQMTDRRTMPMPTALNNQVPPGNRANNYWDNFRSYSRQNLLSDRQKTNEEPPQSSSPSVIRSLNTVRTLAEPGQQTSFDSSNPRNSSAVREQAGLCDKTSGNSGSLNAEAASSSSSSEPQNRSSKLKLNTQQIQNQTRARLPSEPRIPSVSDLQRQELSDVPGPSEIANVLYPSNISVISGPSSHEDYLGLPRLFGMPVSSEVQDVHTSSKMPTDDDVLCNELKELMEIQKDNPDFVFCTIRKLKQMTSDTLRSDTLVALQDVLVSENASQTEEMCSIEEQEHDPSWQSIFSRVMLQIMTFLQDQDFKICTPTLMKKISRTICQIIYNHFQGHLFLNLEAVMKACRADIDQLLSAYHGSRMRSAVPKLYLNLEDIIRREVDRAAELKSKMISEPLVFPTVEIIRKDDREETSDEVNISSCVSLNVECLKQEDEQGAAKECLQQVNAEEFEKGEPFDTLLEFKSEDEDTD